MIQATFEERKAFTSPKPNSHRNGNDASSRIIFCEFKHTKKIEVVDPYYTIKNDVNSRIGCQCEP